MAVEELFRPDKQREAMHALGTADEAHPGVQYLRSTGECYAGGKVWMIERARSGPFADRELDPAETRALFAQKEWQKVCAFQTRNPIHRAHEYLIKCALEIVDGFLIHPAMGETKSDDVPASARMDCYLALIEHYFPAGNVALSAFPYAMRYAGPREAILHALIRQNYGCTHFIVGRDHAGVGSYYGTYDAQKIFAQFAPGEIAITPVMFEHSFYCKRCGGMASQKTCPHTAADRVALSGTRVRELLVSGDALPGEFTRPEIAAILHRHYAQARV
jgi:sulfate adenylyltransferase